MMRHIRKKIRTTLPVLRKAALTAWLVFLAAVLLFPLAVTLTNSFMTKGEIELLYEPLSDTAQQADKEASERYVSLKPIPERVSLSQYYEALVNKPMFLFMFWNSVLLTLPIVAGQAVVASLAAYAFSFLRFPLKEGLFFVYIVTMLMPFQVTLVPSFIVADKLGLLNTHASIVLPGIFGAFGVFLLRQFMVYIPYSYIEAARVDGAGHLRIYAGIVLPMCRSGMAALLILTFVDNWNMVEQPLVFLQDALKQPLSVFMSSINEEERGIAFAAASLYMLPMVLLMLHAENDLVEGIQLSGIKG
ncbi:carbohydrate ABC transporter permease [Paenibacillus hamazuiensis]|uniref:carbohydrate ABC transporter permease n=1 Tax=Paenibacillus hamazuiensis TaxID=2936508 RepID=UPI00200D9BF8|nr:carbohydrate ABC transporter permease [Paenibacillus hamazuiensis]